MKLLRLGVVLVLLALVGSVAAGFFGAGVRGGVTLFTGSEFFKGRVTSASQSGDVVSFAGQGFVGMYDTSSDTGWISISGLGTYTYTAIHEHWDGERLIVRGAVSGGGMIYIAIIMG